MRRLVGFVVGNWPLKLAAILVAVVLYAALVLSENAQVWRGRVAITPLHQPTSAFLLGTLPDVTTINYFAPADVASRLSTSSFSATIDLAGATTTAEDPFVTARVLVSAADPRVQILDYEPQSIRVQLDPLVTKSVPVTVDRGSVPDGLTVREPMLSATTATISGPGSIVRLVVAAVARVLIQPSGIDVDQQVDLVAVDAGGAVMTPVDLAPSTVRVQISVGSQLRSKTLPVAPEIVGTPATGYELGSVDVIPPVATITGEADALAGLSAIATAGVPVNGATADVTRSVSLALPANTSTAGAQTVQVTVHVRALAGSRTFEVGLAASGARPDRTYTLAATSVNMTLGGSLAVLDALGPADLVGSVDVARLDSGTRTLPISYTLPPGTVLIALSPSSVVVTASAASATAPPESAAP